MTEQLFMEAIERHPEVTASGFGGTKWGNVTEDRAALRSFYDAFSKSYEYLMAMSPEEMRKVFQVDSYALKHVVERSVGVYVPEGAFDLAALEIGCSVKRKIEGSPSAYFRIPTMVVS